MERVAWEHIYTTIYKIGSQRNVLDDSGNSNQGSVTT